MVCEMCGLRGHSASVCRTYKHLLEGSENPIDLLSESKSPLSDPLQHSQVPDPEPKNLTLKRKRSFNSSDSEHIIHRIPEAQAQTDSSHVSCTHDQHSRTHDNNVVHGGAYASNKKKKS